MADPNAPADVDPFAAFDRPDPSAGALTTAAGSAAPAKPDPFAQFDRNPGEQGAENGSSATGAFGREAVRGALPALGSLPAMEAGAELGGAGGFAVGGPVGAAVGGFAGGVAGAIGGSYAIGKLQDYALKAVPDSWRDAMGLSDRQQQLDNEQYPKASFLGGVAPYLVTMHPGNIPKVALPLGATFLQKLMANPATHRVFGGLAMGGMELGQEAVSDEGQGVNWNKVAIATGLGVVFNRPNQFGARISAFGGDVARDIPFVARQRQRQEALGLYRAAQASPTLNQAADLGIIGAGNTELTNQGSLAVDPVAKMQHAQYVRDEQAVLGTAPPVTPDLHATARRYDPQLFARYDELTAQRGVFQDWLSHGTPEEAPVAQNHLAAINVELRTLEPEVQAAYRRAAEVQAPTTEPPGAPAQFSSFAEMLAAQGREGAPAAPAGTPGTQAELPGESQIGPTRTIEQQRQFIAGDVEHQLVAAGRPPDEAKQGGAIWAHYFETQARAFDGKLGTPEELYRRGGAEIRGAGAKPPPVAPAVSAPPIAPQEQARQQNIDTSKDVVSGANSSKDPNGPVYIDKRIPQLSPTLQDQAGNPVNLWNSLQLHERVEADEMAKGKSYDEAHVIATAAEKELARRAGYDFDAYTKEMDGYLSGIEHEHAANPPTDAHVDPQAAIGHHKSTNKQTGAPSMTALPAVSEFQKSGMIENAEAYKAAAKARREKSSGSAVKVYLSAEAQARANGTTVKEANAQRAALVAEHGARFDEAVTAEGVDVRDIPKNVREAAVQAMVDGGREPGQALDYATMKDEHEARVYEDERTREIEQGLIENEEGHAADVGDVPFEAGEHTAGTGEAHEGRGAQEDAATGAPARFAGARFPEEVEFYQRGGKERDLIGEREAQGQQQIPGAERISQAELVQRRANQPLKPTVAQKPADEGLFGDAAAQKELFQQQLADPILAPTLERVRAMGSPMDVALRASREPQAVHDDIEKIITGIKQAERDLRQRHGVTKTEDLRDADLTKAESDFLYHGKDETGVEYWRDLSKQLEPVASLDEAAQEIAHEMKRLPKDTAGLSTSDEMVITRLQVLFSEVARLGGDLPAVMKEAGARYGARFEDAEDAEDAISMVRGASERMQALFGERRAALPPPEGREFEQSQLGKITIRPDQRPIITLAKTADASTFIHESGHMFLENLMRWADHPEAPDTLKADRDTTLDWLGLKTRADLDERTKTGNLTARARNAHEKFATGFEQYLREGVAPSPELASVFAKFRDWLLRLYQTLKGITPDGREYNLGAEISPQIREVFDRLLASEPQRTVIAPERAAGPTHGDVWDADAAHTEPHEAEPAMDRVLKETEQYASNLPGSLTNEHAASETKAAASAEPAGEAGVRAGPEGAVEQGGVGPGPEPAGGAGGAATGAGLHGGRNAGAKGVAEPTGRERPGEPGNADAGLGDKPLAPRPKPQLGAAESPFTDKAGNIRLENLTSSEDVAQAIRDAADQNQDFIGDRRGIVTDGQVEGLAEDIGMAGAEKMLKERVKGQAFNAEQIMAARKLLVQSATDVSAAMKKAATGTDEDVMAYAQAKDRHQMIQAQIAGITAEAGRALRAFRNISGMTGELQAVDQILRDATGKTLFQLRREAKLGAELKTPQQVSKFMQDAQYKNFGRMVLEYWINGLISGPVTHATYAVGNEILTLQKAGPETAAAAGIGALRRAMGREGDTVRIGEVRQKLQAHGKSFAPAAKAFFDALRTGQTALLPGETPAQNVLPFGTGLAERPLYDEAAKLSDVMASAYGVLRGIKDGMIAGGELAKAAGVPTPWLGVVPSLKGAIPDIYFAGINVPIGPLARAPGNVVAAVHSFFRGTNYSIEKAGNAFRTATNEGLTGQAFDQRVAIMNQRPSQSEMEQYGEASSETTLMGQGGAFTKALSRLTNHPFFASKDANGRVIPGSGVPLLKFIDPFVTISSNIIQQSIIERTPLGVLSPELRRDLMGVNDAPGSHVVQDTAMARMLVGTAYAVGLAGLAAEGYVSGSAPTDPHDAATWTGAGNQAHSVRVGDLWYDVHRLGPLGMLLGISADLYNVSHDASQGDMLLAASHLQHAITQNILDESFMRGPSDLIRAVEDPGRYGENYIKNFLSSFVPWSVGQAQIARMGDPYSRQARSVMDSIKQKIPGLSESLLPRRDVWGEPIPNKPAFAGLSAIYEQPVSHDPVKLAMERLKVPSTPVQRKIGHAALTDEQYDEYSRTAGQFAKHQLDQLVRSPQFAAVPEAVQKDLMERTIRGAHAAAENIMKAKDRALAIAAQKKPER